MTTTREDVALAPCPFCGAQPVWMTQGVTSGCGFVVLGCTNYDCFGPRTTATGDDAIAQWNTRSLPDAATIERLREKEAANEALHRELDTVTKRWHEQFHIAKKLRETLEPFAKLVDHYETECGNAARIISWIDYIADYRWPTEQECINARIALRHAGALVADQSGEGR